MEWLEMCACRYSFMVVAMCHLDALGTCPNHHRNLTAMLIACWFLSCHCLCHLCSPALYYANSVDNQRWVDVQRFRLHRLAYFPIDLSDRVAHCIVPIGIQRNPCALRMQPSAVQFYHRNRLEWYPFRTACACATQSHRHLQLRTVNWQSIDLSFRSDGGADPFCDSHAWDCHTDGSWNRSPIPKIRKTHEKIGTLR